jgi:hypothetical protein
VAGALPQKKKVFVDFQKDLLVFSNMEGTIDGETETDKWIIKSLPVSDLE